MSRMSGWGQSKGHAVTRHYVPGNSNNPAHFVFKPAEPTPLPKPAPKSAPKPAPRPAPKSAPAPAPKPKPVVHSPEIKQAKERVNKYQTDVKEGKPSEEIYGNKDYSKDSYINPYTSKQPQIFDFSQSAFSN